MMTDFYNKETYTFPEQCSYMCKKLYYVEKPNKIASNPGVKSLEGAKNFPA
jgi:hypothetical protein